MDRVITPEQRASILAKLQEFMLKNPKLSVSFLFFFTRNIPVPVVPSLGLLFFAPDKRDSGRTGKGPLLRNHSFLRRNLPHKDQWLTFPFSPLRPSWA